MNYRIKEVREMNGITQERLSEISGVSRKIISDLETGKRTNTSVGTLLRISSALGVSLEYLFCRDRITGNTK